MTATTAHTAAELAVGQALAHLPTTPAPAPKLAVVCGACELFGEPIDANEAIAQDYAGTHDDLHHRGHPTADLLPYPPAAAA